MSTPTQTKSLLQSLEQAAGCIGLNVNAAQIEYVFFIKKETSQH